jgi:hypothetical protein
MRVPQPAPLGGHKLSSDTLALWATDELLWPARQIRSTDRFPVFMVIVSHHGSAAVRARLVGDVAESVEQMGLDSSAAVFGLATADVRLA